MVKYKFFIMTLWTEVVKVQLASASTYSYIGGGVHKKKGGVHNNTQNKLRNKSSKWKSGLWLLDNNRGEEGATDAHGCHPSGQSRIRRTRSTRYQATVGMYDAEVPAV